MSATKLAQQTSSDDTAIRPFQVGFSGEALADLCGRIHATRRASFRSLR